MAKTISYKGGRRDTSIFPYLHTDIRYQFFGMQRSGTHAFAYWLLAHFEGSPFWYSIENHCPPQKSMRVPQFYNADKCTKKYQYRYGLFMCEDMFNCRLAIKDNLSCFYDKRRKNILGSFGKIINIIFLRDPFNLFASRYKHLLDSSEKQKKILGYMINSLRLELWKSLARICLDDVKVKKPFIFISYNLWCSSESYRKKLSTKLSLVFTDTCIDYVPEDGAGSSFDGMFFQGRASKMEVTERWKKFKNDPVYKGLFDDEIRDLSDRLFSFVPF